MTVKEYLNQARRLDAEVAQLRRLKDQAYDRARSATVQPDRAAVCGGGQRDVFAVYAQYAAALEEEAAALLALQRAVREVIRRVSDARYRQLLTARYLEGKTWEQIACEMDYCYMQVCRLHGQALAAVEQIM